MEQSLWRKHVPNRWHRYIAALMLAVGCSVISIMIYLDFDELGILFWFAMLVAGLFGFIQLGKQLGKWLPSFFRFLRNRRYAMYQAVTPTLSEAYLEEYFVVIYLQVFTDELIEALERSQVISAGESLGLGVHLYALQRSLSRRSQFSNLESLQLSDRREDIVRQSRERAQALS